MRKAGMSCPAAPAKRKSTEITKPSCTFYKLGSTLHDVRTEVPRSANPHLPSREAHILHQRFAFISEAVISRSSVPPGRVAAGVNHACGGESHHRDDGVRPPL